MNRFLGFGLSLLVVVLILAGAGCTTEKTPVADNPSVKKTPEKKTPEGKTLSEQLLDYYHRDIDQYHFLTQDPEALRPKAVEFMEAVQKRMLPHPRGLSIDTLHAMGQDLINNGCTDPLVLIYYGMVVSWKKGIYEALPLFSQGQNAMRSAGYPPECRQIAVFTMYAHAKYYKKMLPWDQLRLESGGIVNSIISDETIPPEMSRLILWQLSNFVSDTSGNDWEDFQYLFNLCSKEPKLDPWVLKTIEGRYLLTKGWHHRGNGWANTVTPEGWKQFGEHLEKAAQCFEEALKIHPDFPEPACDMIGVAMAGGSDRSPQEWFMKTAALEFDHMQAYDKILCTLFPRWGGSHEALYEFGKGCAETERFDTNVPLVFLYALNSINNDSENDMAAWKKPGVYEELKAVLDKAAADPARQDGVGLVPTKSGIKSIQVALAQRLNKFEDARRLLDELGDNLDRNDFDAYCYQPDRVLAYIYAASGPAKEYVTKGWDEFHDAPRPFTREKLEEVKGYFQKAVDAEVHPTAQKLCRCWVQAIKSRIAYGDGEWLEEQIDPDLFVWEQRTGIWQYEDEHSIVGHVRNNQSIVTICPSFHPYPPYELEFDIKTPFMRYPVNFGLFLPTDKKDSSSRPVYTQIYIRTRENQAGIDFDGKSKTVPCNLQETNRLHIYLSEKCIRLYVNDEFCLERTDVQIPAESVLNFGCLFGLYPHQPVHIGNVRFRKWTPPETKSEEKEMEKTNAEATKSEDAVLEEGKTPVDVPTEENSSKGGAGEKMSTEKTPGEEAERE